jgi:type VI secretion system secreted protein VgrG
VTAEEWGDGREINTNKQGDARIRFAWDERPKEPGVASSRWVRVSEPWGGVGYGAMWTPRVGDLVVVGFREGDPDDPLIVGRAYSTQMPAPYDAAKHPTVSTFKTRSSPGGDGFNELRFEDAAGAERVDLTAQRDLDVKVGRDCTVTIGRHESVTVRGDVRRTVVGRQVDAVDGDAELSSKGQLTISGVGVEINSSKTMKLHAAGDMTLSTDANRTDQTHGNHFIQSGSTYMRSQDVVQVVAPHFHVFADDIRLVRGGSSIVISNSGITITSTGDVEVNGAYVKLNCD